MSPLLLICDPTYDYTRSFHEMLGDHDIDSRHVLTGSACLQSIQLFAPEFVLVSCETDDGFIIPLLNGIDCNPNRHPYVFLVGTATSQELADIWGHPQELCLTIPFDETAFVQKLAALVEEPTLDGVEREDGVGAAGLRPAGLNAWENEGGSVHTAVETHSSTTRS